MAIPSLKSTYVLDLDTAKTLDRLASEWQVSKSEALRRLINSAGASTPRDRVSRFRQLQKMAALNRTTAQKWTDDVRAERKGMGHGRSARR